MNDSSSVPGITETQALAEQEVLSLGMTILDRRWVSEAHELSLVASARGGVLVVVDVLDPSVSVHDYADNITEERVSELRAAADAWIDEHSATFQGVRIDAAGFGRHGFHYVTEVG